MAKPRRYHECFANVEEQTSNEETEFATTRDKDAGAVIRRYQNRTIEDAQVLAGLIELANQMREGQKRGDKLGLTDDEVAFYDALETNDSAVKVLGEPTLNNIAQTGFTGPQKRND